MTEDQINSVVAAPHALGSRDISDTIIAARSMPTGRMALPDRRQNVTVNTEWTAADVTHRFTVTVGLADGGRPMEVFADNAKGAMQATVSDACVLASIAMQFGATPNDLAKSLGRVPAWVNGREGEGPASPIGAIAAAILQVSAPRDAIGEAGE